MERDFDTLIISDVHLGSEISRARDALSLLKSTNFRRLILLGDIFNDLNFRRLKKEHWQFLSYVRKLSNPKRNVEVVWVEGNHDLGLSDLMSHLVGIPVYQHYVWQFGEKRYLAIHGHQFDRFISRNYVLSRFGEALFLWIQKADARRKKLSRFLDRLNTRWLRLSDNVARGAIAFAKNHGADQIFCGHTHVPMFRERNGVRYFNSGSWIGEQCSYITVGEQGVELHEQVSVESFHSEMEPELGSTVDELRDDESIPAPMQ